MGRMYQVFIAPGDEDLDLPIEPSPWQYGRVIRIPLEHWQLILDFAEKIDAEITETLRYYSFSEADDLLLANDQFISVMTFIDRVKAAILAADPLVPVATEEFPDDHTNEEHVRMLANVAAVIRESVLLNQPFRAYVD